MVENRLASASTSGARKCAFNSSESTHFSQFLLFPWEHCDWEISDINLPDSQPCRVPRKHSMEGHHGGHMQVLTAERNWRCCRDHHVVITYVGLSVTSPLTEIWKVPLAHRSWRRRNRSSHIVPLEDRKKEGALRKENFWWVWRGTRMLVWLRLGFWSPEYVAHIIPEFLLCLLLSWSRSPSTVTSLAEMKMLQRQTFVFPSDYWNNGPRIKGNFHQKYHGGRSKRWQPDGCLSLKWDL